MYFFLASLPFLLKIFSLNRVLGLITPKEIKDSNKVLPRDKVIRYGKNIFKRHTLLQKNVCLKRSLLLYYFLRRNGDDIRIHFGIKRQGGKLTGHNWRTHQGKRLADPGGHGDFFTTILSYLQKKDKNSLGLLI